MTLCQLADLCGARSGDKLDVSDVSLFADDRAVYDALCRVVTAERVAEHFDGLVDGPVERYLVPNVLALKFVLHRALAGGASVSLRSDSQGKTHGLLLLRMRVDLPEDIVHLGRRRGRPPL
jgi:hypothetical protein